MGQRYANKYSGTEDFSDQKLCKPHGKGVWRGFCNVGLPRTVKC